MHWVYIEFTSLTLDHACIAPCQQAQPVIVYEEKTNRIVQLNVAAYQAGLTPGMGMAQTAALSADVTILLLDVAQQNKYLNTLATHLYQVASDIVLYPPDAIAIRLDNLAQYYGSDEAAWQTIQALILQRQLGFRFADGWSPLTAKLLAKAETNRLLSCRQAIWTAIRQCTINHTDLTDKDIALLRRIGLHNLSQVLSLPISELGKRFKNNTIVYLNELRGETFPTVRYFQPEEHCQLSIEPAYEIAEAPRCRPWLIQLLQDLEVFLRIRNLKTAKIVLAVHFREHDPDTHVISSSAPLARHQDWLTLVDVWLDTLALSSPLVSLSLHCDELEKIEGDNRDFFTDRHQYFANQQLLSRLRTRLGEAAIWQPYVRDDHRVHCQTAHTDCGITPQENEFCPALGIQKPILHTDEGMITFGPVRIQSGWWDHEPVKRDYYILRTTEGAYRQIFRDQQQHWYVQGFYS